MLCKGWGPWRAAVVAMLLVLPADFGGLFPGAAQARERADLAPAGTISIAQLPPQGRNMMGLIYRGGPFGHEKDGVVFGNRERILPARNRGYYREYTVRTPGDRSRGARRIICGGLSPATPDVCYYSFDHYASFRKIVQ